MRRRNSDFRRPVRRRFSNVFWVTVCGLAILLLIILLSRETRDSSSALVYTKRSYIHDRIIDDLNITEEMLRPESMARQLNDQISLAEAIVVISKESNNLQFAWELSAHIRNSQTFLSNAASRRSPLTNRESENAIRDMTLLLYQAQQLHYDSATMIMRLKAKIQSLEEQSNSFGEKSSKYGQIVVEGVRKSLYCLGVRLTAEWFRSSNLQRKLKEEKQVAAKLVDTGLFHFCEFSDNILATSAVVNSTGLFSTDLNGKINGAVETYMETFHRYHKYLNYFHPLIHQHFDPDACGWAFKMNIFDLVEWRKRNVTGIYHYWQEKNVDRTLWKLGTLPPGLLTFYGLTEALDPSWHVLGLGYTNVDPKVMEKVTDRSGTH